MDAPVRVRCLQPPANLDGSFQCGDNVERPLIDFSGQGLTLDKFHCDVGRYRIVNHFIYCGYLRAIQTGGGTRLFAKSRAGSLIRERRSQNKF